MNGTKFGIVNEYLVGKDLGDLKPRTNRHHDGLLGGLRVEIKGSRVLTQKTEYDNYYDELVSDLDRGFSSINGEDYIQITLGQVKPNEFDLLYYALYFDESVALCRATVEEVLNDKNLKYFGKMHKGNIGEGQMRIYREDLDYHINNKMYKQLTWKQVENLLK